MKTKKIASLKKELLLVELPKNGYYENYIDGTEIRDFLTDEVLVILKSDYTLLGSPDEIKEEDVVDLCDRIGINNPLADCDFFAHYGNDETMFEYATESFNSALESEIETFDKKRILIFVKN